MSEEILNGDDRAINIQAIEIEQRDLLSEIATLKSQLAEKDREIEKLKKALKDKDFVDHRMSLLML